MARSSRNERGALLSIRSTLVLLLALIAGALAASLATLADRATPIAVLAGLAAVVGGARFFDWLIA